MNEAKGKEKNILTQAGCRNTRSRKAVILVLEKSEMPVSADEIYLNLKESGHNTNLSTVYRTLELLESKGLVEKTIMNDGKARYMLISSGHKHHLICTQCHKTVSINVCPIEKLAREVGKETNFDVTGHRLELYGICPHCKK